MLAEHAAGRHSTVLPTQTGDTLAAAVVMLQALHRLGVGPEIDAEEVARVLDDVAIACSPHRDIAVNPAKDLALALADSTPLVWGGSVLAARAARRVAEAIRRTTGRPALAADAEHLLPGDRGRPRPRPVRRPVRRGRWRRRPRPGLLVLDDGAEEASIREQRGWLGRDRRSPRRAGPDGARPRRAPEVARYAALLSTGSYAAAYLGVGLGRDRRGGPGATRRSRPGEHGRVTAGGHRGAAANLGIAVTKLVAFALTGASSMLAEAIHSVADSGNQGLLLLGGKRSTREPTRSTRSGSAASATSTRSSSSIVLFTRRRAVRAVRGLPQVPRGARRATPTSCSTSRWWWVPLVVLAARS